MTLWWISSLRMSSVIVDGMLAEAGETCTLQILSLFNELF